jgi:predicted alpha-1,2-mannosidase
MKKAYITYHIFLFITLGFLTACIGQEPAALVNPFIGTTNFGATHPGPVRPAGMASVVPFNVAFRKGEENKHEKDSEWHSRPYVYDNNFLTGFSHVNLSGVGCPDLGSILLMPTSDSLFFDPEKNGSAISDQSAKPGSYTCTIDKHSIDVELCATERVGLSRYTFRKGQANILLNLGLGLTNETGAQLKIVSPTEISGYKIFGDFCYTPSAVRPVYFYMKVNKAPDNFGAWKKMPNYVGVEGEWSTYNDKYKPYPEYQQELAGENLGTYLTYFFEEKTTVEVAIGISYTSVENAKRNLEEETKEKDFDEIRDESFSIWNNMLNRIKITDANKERKTIFYTALYHLLLHPNLLQDVSGDYPAMASSEILNTGGKNRYTVFSLWDTYRNVHPFLSLVYPELQSVLCQNMVDMYSESGWLPKWELMGMETNVMVGDPATPVLADTYLRGIQDFDYHTAYNAARKTATQIDDNPIRKDIKDYTTLGYIPQNFDNLYYGSVSASLEYNIADWNLAMFAQALEKRKDYNYFLDRSMSYKKYYDSETQMLRPRVEGGAFYDKFDPELGKNFEANVGFVEGNAWQYRFFVPHGTRGLIKLIGGEKKFIHALQTCFDDGHYDAANEPDITYPYLFNFVKGEEWRTQKTVQELVNKHYTNAPDGLPGNDDTGTLSCWLLYSMMGIYPHCPGDMNYAISTPMFDKIEIALNPRYYNGKSLIISRDITEKKGEQFIDKMSWNNQNHKTYFINHHKLVEGGNLHFTLKTM